MANTYTFKRCALPLEGKGYRVLRNGLPIAFIENDSDFGWIVYKDQHSDWFLGVETLGEVKGDISRLDNLGLFNTTINA